MKAILLDMYGVIVKQTGVDFVPYVQQTLKRDVVHNFEELRKRVL